MVGDEPVGTAVAAIASAATPRSGSPPEDPVQESLISP